MKNIMKVLGIIAIAAVIGLSMTSCEPEAKTVDIVVTNSSYAPNTDRIIKAQVWGTAGGYTPLEEQSILIGESGTFTMDEGDYRVCVIDGVNWKYWYPSGGASVITMTGVVNLKFTGGSLVLQ